LVINKEQIEAENQMQVFGNNAITQNWYEARIQTLTETTSPEESRLVLTALETLRAPSENPIFPLGLPVRWMSMLQHIHGLEPEQRRQTSALVSRIVLQVFSESIPPAEVESQAEESSERPIQRPHVEIGVPSNPFLILSEGLFVDIIDRLPPQSRCQFAQACRLSRNLVRAYREERLNRYEAFPGLRPLISYFCQHIPDVRQPETLDPWQHELRTEAIPILLENLLVSSIPTEAEKMAFRTQAETQIASNPQLLHQLLFRSYQLNLVILALRGSWYDSVTIAKIDMQQLISERPSLREKAEAVATLVQLHADILFTIYYDGPIARAGERMTCLPQEVLSLRVKNLFLNGHLIRALPEEICCLGGDLQKLSLSQNRIKALPKSFFVLSNLCDLHVDEHLVEQIPRFIRELPGLFINGELANPGLQDMLSEEFSEFVDELQELAEELLAFAKILSRLALSPIRALSGQT
jgi:hypothetical protein